MGNIEWLVKYEREGTNLDFKREQYQKEKNKDLIKDIMSMANAPIDGKKYIIVGVKDKPDGTKEFHPIPRESVIDQATYEQVIRENIEPAIEFSYSTVEIDGNLLGVFEIGPCNNPPYMMKKDFQSLKKGDCYIRRGSQQDRLTRRDLDELLVFRSNYYFNGKISVGFNNKLEKKIIIEGNKEIRFPSDLAKERIETELNRREKELEVGTVHADSRIFNPFQATPYEKRSTETLKENLKNVKKTYNEDDWYYIGEEISDKFNIILRNDGDKYLEDVSIRIKIPREAGIIVMDRIHEKPLSGIQALVPPPPNATLTTVIHYPSVETEEHYYVVEENIGALKHQQNTEAFGEELRVSFGPRACRKIFSWEYTIYAKNLPKPINGELKIEVV
ncbi:MULTISPECIES: ATP-binding protein [Bacillus cereus group]|uniref:ATP-binding protein n=1 Tax=Bacillus paranthracis TaxID=2026186 RepID=A0AAX3Q7I5_9BACI|nr:MULTISPECIES: ATP-binding protein [Bacillus cereus group]WES06010.1 ATP-binding protein [Bacillus paranthracis]WKT30362.1 ATP-binding protein [Bacillus cereus]HDR4445049.1 ATP-binding protein [Bacillus cereus]HDR6295465.1 ATP-binding protein [Bacillus cereus]